MKLFRVIAFGLLLLAFQAKAIQNVEVYTYDVLPPYAYKNTQGELTGLYIDIVKTAVSRMPDYSVSFNVVPWARVKYYASHGTAFAVLPPYFHAHDWLTDSEPKRPYIWPYSLPLYTQEDAVICNSRVLNKPRKKFPEDYQDLSFVMWRGDGRANQAFNKLVEEKKIKVFIVNSIKETVAVLHQGRQDCTITAKYPFHWYVREFQKTPEFLRNPSKVTLEQMDVVSKNEVYLGYTDINTDENFPFKKDFSIKFDIEIYKMKQSGELDQIIRRYVNEDILDVSIKNPKGL